MLHPNGAKMSDRAIAEHVGVDEKTVRKYRGELESTAETPQCHARTGRDGRTTNTARIGSLPSAKKPESEVPDPALYHQQLETLSARKCNFRKSPKATPAVTSAPMRNPHVMESG